MKDHGVRTRQKDTNNSFDLITLQRCLVNDIKAVRPDWIVYLGIDIIYSLQKTLRETIEEADGNGFNMISVQHIGRCYAFGFACTTVSIKHLTICKTDV